MSHRPRVLRLRTIVMLIIVLATLPMIALVSAGVILLQQDRALDEQRRKDHLSAASSAVVAAMERSVVQSERSLAARQTSWPEGAIAVTFRNGAIEVTPTERIAFLRVPKPLDNIPPTAFASIRSATSTNPGLVVPGPAYGNGRGPNSPSDAVALLRLGRQLAGDGKTNEALAAFDRLLQAPAVTIGNTPSPLVARYWRCRLLDRANRRDELRDESLRFAGDLRTFATSISGSVYKDYAQLVQGWSHEHLPEAPLARSEVIETLWERWQAGMVPLGTSKREVIPTASTNVAVLWQTDSSDSSTMRILLATPDFVSREWMTPARQVALDAGASIEISPDTSTPDPTIDDANTAKRNGGVLSRTARPVSLPWVITLTEALPTRATEQSRSRRTLVLASLMVLTILIGASAYGIVSAVRREFAVARLQSEFVAAVSHEFRTPLTALRQFVTILREQPMLDDERRRVCYDAQARAVDRLSRLVESVLDFGRLDTDAPRYQFTTQDCGALVRAVVDDFNHHASHAGYHAQLETHGRHAAAMVHVDSDAVTRALWNLLDNAMKYSPEHKTITVDVQNTGTNACIAVRDRGLGIPSGETADIFRRFQRGSEARSRGIPGTGIGLTMVVDIMRAHRGRVHVATELGQGSIFTLVLPLAS